MSRDDEYMEIYERVEHAVRQVLEALPWAIGPAAIDEAAETVAHDAAGRLVGTNPLDEEDEV